MNNVNAEPAISSEALAQAGGIKVERPARPAIPLSEGQHFQVTTGENIPWRRRSARELQRMTFMALPTAKVVSEGRESPDMWANIHLNARPGYDSAVNVYGRNPESSTGWGKPVNMRDLADGQVPAEAEAARSESVLSRYLPRWERLMPQVNLFPDGVGELSPNDPEYQAENETLAKKNEKLIWANKKFSLVIINSPHLSGLHMVVHPNQKYWEEKGGFKRAWQVDRGKEGEVVDQEHVQGLLEATSIAIGAEQVTMEGEDGVQFYNPEVHISGNWAGDLKPVEAGGKLDTSYLSQEELDRARKDEKREHRIGAEGEWQTAMHAHLYATRDPDRYVSLPSRPQSEVPEQWEGITPMSESEVEKISSRINERLTPWLEQNAAGNLAA